MCLRDAENTWGRVVTSGRVTVLQSVFVDVFLAFVELLTGGAAEKEKFYLPTCHVNVINKLT